MAVSLKNIASRAGITKAAVSMALRDHPSISVLRRQQVQKLADEMGYRPNLVARGLVTGRTQSIGIAWALGRPIAGGIVQDLALRLRNRGYLTAMTNSLGDPDVTRKILSDFAQRGVDGIVIQVSHGDMSDSRLVGQLKGFRAAVVVADEYEESPVDLVVQDTPHGIRQLMDYWLTTGRKRIGFFGEVASNHEKIDPMRRTLQASGLTDDHLIVLDLGHEPPMVNYFDNYWSVLERSFPSPDGPFPCDAVLCAADGGAGALLRWLQRRGLRLPQDVAVAGVGNVDLARATTPPLASLDRHGDTLSQAIEASLLRRLERPTAEIQVKTVPSTFVWRESAGLYAPEATSAGKVSLCQSRATVMI